VRELNYLRPDSLKEALTLLSQYENRAGIMAGGTDLLAMMKKGLEVPEVILNIEGLCELNYIQLEDSGILRIGAITSLAEIEESLIIRQRFSVLSEAASMMGSPTIRKRATIGGNLCNAAPSADTMPALMVLGATIVIESREGQNSVSVDELFLGPGQTILQSGQIVTEIEIPELASGSGAAYIKHKRRAGADLAVAGVAAMATISGDYSKSGSRPIIQEIKLALAAVAPTPIRAKKAETLLRGQEISSGLLAAAGAVAANECSPIDDVRSSAIYRKKLIEVLVPRAIRAAIERAKVKLEK
jgi:carbon-monoxide dehydrogenase medium subunit